MGMSDSLRSRTIRLASANPEIRLVLLPLLKEAALPPILAFFQKHLEVEIAEEKLMDFLFRLKRVGDTPSKEDIRRAAVAAGFPDSSVNSAVSGLIEWQRQQEVAAARRVPRLTTLSPALTAALRALKAKGKASAKAENDYEKGGPDPVWAVRDFEAMLIRVHGMARAEAGLPPVHIQVRNESRSSLLWGQQSQDIENDLTALIPSAWLK